VLKSLLIFTQCIKNLFGFETHDSENRGNVPTIYLCVSAAGRSGALPIRLKNFPLAVRFGGMSARASGSIIKVYCTLSGFNLSIVTARIRLTLNKKGFTARPQKFFFDEKTILTPRREIRYFKNFMK
jgi:hypothetical protein